MTKRYSAESTTSPDPYGEFILYDDAIEALVFYLVHYCSGPREKEENAKILARAILSSAGEEYE